MDHGRKINKIETLTLKRPKVPFVMVKDPVFVKDKPLVEDHRLINWKRWLKRRQKQYEALNDGRSQSKTEIVMNSCERIRPKVEMNNLLECAMISASSVPDKYRGSPTFWKVPPCSPSHGSVYSSEIRPALTKKELTLLPTLEYVDVPIHIREEKSLPIPLQKDPAWIYSSYLREKKKELADTIATLQPSVPETASLIVRGQGFGRGEKYVTHVPVISITDTSVENYDSDIEVQEPLINTDIVVALKINDLEIARDKRSIAVSSENASEETTWTMNFSSKKNQRLEKYLCFENTGTVAITYRWRSAVSTPEHLPLSPKNLATFFFNKNKALILPGQKVKFPVWYQNRQDGFVSEAWRMLTDPIVSRAALIIRMNGYTVVEDIYISQFKVDLYLDRCIRNTIVRELIEEIIQNGRPSEPREPTYKSLFLEADLFRAKNPSYFYHSSLVAQLHRLYATTSVSDASSWSLSLSDLRHVLLQIKNPDLRHEKLKVFSDLCQQCLRPCLFNPVRNTKYAIVYNILCSFANRMEEESNFVKRICILGHSVTPTKSETRSSCDSSLAILDDKSLPTTLDPIAIALHREVFYVRIYELLVEAVEQSLAAIDSMNNLNELEP